MAIAIKSIPVLKSEAAEAFEKKVYANNDKRATIDFSRQINQAAKILAKAKIK